MRAAVVALALVAGCAGGVSSLEWMAMGTVAKVSFKGKGDFDRREVCARVRATYEAIEARLSVWRPDSEISRYASLEAVSPETRPCYETAFRLREISGGAFNPFWRGKGKGPDLGGIAKGFAVDLAAERLKGLNGDLLLDLGGNLKVVSGTWRTGIRDPFGGGGIVRTLILTNGMACATSGEYERGKHIHDGRTGAPVTNDVASVTVVHPTSAMIADGLSTTLFVLGREKGEAFLKAHYPEATAYWVGSAVPTSKLAGGPTGSAVPASRHQAPGTNQRR